MYVSDAMSEANVPDCVGADPPVQFVVAGLFMPLAAAHLSHRAAGHHSLFRPARPRGEALAMHNTTVIHIEGLTNFTMLDSSPVARSSRIG